jgi:bifunctional NMN adenylyltransferase/nudix hydrolase
MTKPFKLGFFLGRLQPIHHMHEQMIRIGLHNCEQMIILLGSAQEVGTIMNPFDWQLRKKLIEKVFKHDKNVHIIPIPDLTADKLSSYDWGNYVLTLIFQKMGMYPDLMICGSEQSNEGWFDKERDQTINKLFVSRLTDPVSGTFIRQLLLEKKYGELEKHLNPAIYDEFDRLHDVLLQIL